MNNTLPVTPEEWGICVINGSHEMKGEENIKIMT